MNTTPGKAAAGRMEQLRERAGVPGPAFLWRRAFSVLALNPRNAWIFCILGGAGTLIEVVANESHRLALARICSGCY